MARVYANLLDPDDNVTGIIAVTVTLGDDIDQVLLDAGVVAGTRYLLEVAGTATEPRVVTPADSAPVFTADPVAAGSPVVGSTVTVSVGTVVAYPIPDFSFQWMRALGDPITDATGQSYVLTSAEEGFDPYCDVTADNGVGSPATASSNGVGVVQAASSAPTAIAGTLAVAGGASAAVGHTISWPAGSASGTPTPSVTDQLTRAPTGTTTWENVSSTGRSYTFTAADEDYDFSVLYTATSTAGSDTDRSNTIGPVAAASADITVTSMSALNTALAAATGGERIVCTSGVSGALTLSNESYASPVTVVAQTTYGTTLGRVTLSNIDNLNIEGFKITTGTNDTVPVVSITTGCTGIGIRGNEIYGLVDTGDIYGPSEGVLCDNSSGLRIENNYIHDCRYPTRMNGCEDWWVLSNRYENTGDDTVRVGGGSDDFRIENNTGATTYRSGVDANGDEWHEDFIQFTGTSPHSNGVIRGNVSLPHDEWDVQGIFLGAPQGGFSNIVVENNIVSGTGNGISINGGSNCRIQGNWVLGDPRHQAGFLCRFESAVTGGSITNNIWTVGSTGSAGLDGSGNLKLQDADPGAAYYIGGVFPRFTASNVPIDLTDLEPAAGSLGETIGAYARWLEATGTTPPADTTDPIITGPTGAAGAASISITVSEGATAIGTWTASESGTWSKSGADAADITLNTTTGVVTFTSPPDYEDPDDTGLNNVYDFTLTFTDGGGNTASQDVSVTVSNIAEGAGATITSEANVLSTSANTGTSFTATSDFTVAGGAGTALGVLVEFIVGTTPPPAESMTVTAEGVAMTRVIEKMHSGGAGQPGASIWRLSAPTAGAKTIVVGIPGGGSLRGLIVHAFDLAGVDTVTPIGATASGETNAAHPTMALAPQKSGSVILSALAARGPSGDPMTPAAGVTEVYDAETGAGSDNTEISAWVGHRTTSGTSSVSVGATPATTLNTAWVAAEFR